MYILNLDNVICQFYLNKAEVKTDYRAKRISIQKLYQSLEFISQTLRMGRIKCLLRHFSEPDFFMPISAAIEF